MSPFPDDLEAQLRDAARAQSQDPAPAPRRARRGPVQAGLRAVPVALAVAVTLAVTAGALLLAGRGGPTGGPSAAPAHAPSLTQIIRSTPPAQLRREVAYIAAATRRVASAPVCQVRLPPSGSTIPGSPGRPLLAMLGVLRRPATAADRPPSALLQGAFHIYAGFVRRALVVHGVSYYIAAQHFDPTDEMPSVRCFTLQEGALKRSLPSIPAGLRGPTQLLQARYMAYSRHLVDSAPRTDLCLITRGGGESGASCGIAPQEIAHAGIPTEDNGTYMGIARDGVATVTMTLPATGSRPARSVTARVRNNIFAIRGGPMAGAPAGTTVLWRSIQGRVLSRGTQPSAAAAAARCSHSADCAVARAGAIIQSGGSSGSGGSATSTSSSAVTVTRSVSAAHGG